MQASRLPNDRKREFKIKRKKTEVREIKQIQ